MLFTQKLLISSELHYSHFSFVEHRTNLLLQHGDLYNYIMLYTSQFA
jgi:hypothetical protein